MCWPELDGRFYKIAMSFFIETGHTSVGEPEYVNFASELLVNKRTKLKDLFGNLSFLFMTHQCMFFSVELLSSRKERSQVAQAIHKKIHSRIETAASACFFRHENEVMLTLIGYQSKCILSDWYPLADYRKLAEGIDIANISTISDYGYFYGLIYSLKRNCFRFNEEVYYEPFLKNSIHSVKLFEKDDASVDDIPWDKVLKKIKRYCKDYDNTIGKSYFNTVCKLDMMFHVDYGKAYNPFGDELQFDNTDDFFENNIIKMSLSETDRKQEKIVPKKVASEPFTSPKPRIEHIGPRNSIVRQASQKVMKRIDDRFVHSYISNIAFPKTLEELENIYIKEVGNYDLEEVLDGYPGSWTAPKWAKLNDVVFFMHASTARATISALSSELKRESNLYDEEEVDLLNEWLLRGKELYNLYGGKIFAVGRVASEPYYFDTDDNVHWSSRVYVDIKNCWVLEKPVDISMFRSFISISRFSSITRVHSEEYERLKRMIIDTNPNPPEFFVHSIMSDLG